MLHNLLIILFILVSGGKPTSDKSWQLVKDKDGILVYTSDSESSALKSIKVSAVLDGTPEKLWAVVQDVSKQQDWVYATKSSKLLKKTSASELLYYVETEVPWPASNRDIAIRMKMTENKANQSLTINTVGLPKAMPVNNGKVRVPNLAARWEVKSVGRNKIRVDYFLDLDPGGAIPAWISNLFVTKGPYETFANLRELLKK
ncbi:START domain-containing protein [Pontibacter vulgaris]|uniref:START domain-containing protein n=1 Tax=Pontibacter vulgaris TaxID=2905679 RepID=UPI001FA6AD17|nr:START domain-containing protein [Pontibacter vulgaris]